MSKTPDTKLFDLIKTLSQTEKRYFKVRMKKNSDKESYQFIELFNLIGSMEHYDENELKNQLKKKGNDKHLPFRKTHLYELVLSSLRNYHKTKSSEIEVLNLLQDIKITFDRGLFLQSEKLLKKLKKKCSTYNLNQYLISAIYWEQKLIGNLKGKAFKGSSNYQTEKKIITKVFEAQQNLLSYLKKNMELWRLRIELIDFYRFEEAELKKPIEQFKKEVIACINSDPPNKDHLEFTIQSHTINSMIYYFEGNYNAYVKVQKKLILLLEKEQKFVKNNINTYASGINNFLAASFDADKTDDVEKWLDVLKVLLSNIDVRSNVYLSSRIFSFYQVNSLRFYNRIGNYQDAINSFSESQFNMYRFQMNPYKQFQIRYNLVISYFYSEDFRASRKWINKIINSNIEIRLNELSFIRSLSYVIHYQLGYTSIIESLYNSKDKNTVKKLKVHKSEYVLLNGLYSMCMDPDNRKKIKNKFIDKLSEIAPKKSYDIHILINYLRKRLK
jgi:hypothetical protein